MKKIRPCLTLSKKFFAPNQSNNLPIFGPDLADIKCCNQKKIITEKIKIVLNMLKSNYSSKMSSYI